MAEPLPNAVTHRMDDPGFVAATITGGLSDHGSPRLMDVASGDLNGDGLDDLVIGAPGYDAGGLLGGGSVFVLLGRKDLPLGAPSTLDLSEIKNFDLRIDATLAGAQLGTRVAVADVTGDGVDDLVMTALGGKGAVYIKAGIKAPDGAGDADGKGFPKGVVSLAQDRAFDWSFVGSSEGAMLGAVLCVGDLNADKYADLVFGGLEFNDSGAVTATALYAIPGRESWSRRSYEGDERVPGRVRMVRALGQHARAMHTCAIGDLDDNGAGDLVAGMPLDNLSSRPEVGSVAVIFDVLTRSLGSVDLGDPAAGFGLRLVGDQAGGRFGYSLAVSDFNGDHRPDLAVGVPGRTITPEGASKDKEKSTPEGMVMLFWGRLQRGHPPKAPNRVLVGTPQAPTGQSLLVLDLVDDAPADLVLMSPSAAADVGPGAGRVDIYASGLHMHDPGAEAEGHTGGLTPSLRLIGGGAQQRIGWSITTADLNGDGRREWILRNAWHPSGRSTAGSVAIFSAPEAAKTHHTKTHEILFDDALNPLTLLGPGRGGGLSPRLIASADLDGDGIPDPIWISPEGHGRSGVACIQRSTLTPQTATRSIADADGCDLRLTSPPGAKLTSLSVGDFNGDRRPDFAVGMDNHTVNGQPVGAVVVVPLPADGVRTLELGQDPKTHWWWSGGPGSEGLGVDVRLSDINGDGIDDLLMAADRASFEDYDRAGALMVVLGGDLKPGNRSAALEDSEDIFLRLEGAEGARLGLGSQVLDFDADGSPDLLVPAPFASPAGRLQAGSAYVIYSISRLKPGRYAIEDETVSALRFMGPSQGAHLEHFADVTDLDGDGIDDLLFQAPLSIYEGGVRGSIHIIYGRRERIGPYIDLGQREGNDLVIVGERLSGRLIGPAVGDINGDGARDLVVSAQWAGLLETGRAYVLLADPSKPFKGYLRLDQPGNVQHLVHGVEPHAGLSLPSMLPDLDHDGRQELWFISPFADALRSDQGRAFRVVLTSQP